MNTNHNCAIVYINSVFYLINLMYIAHNKGDAMNGVFTNLM